MITELIILEEKRETFFSKKPAVSTLWQTETAGRKNAIKADDRRIEAGKCHSAQVNMCRQFVLKQVKFLKTTKKPAG